MTGPPPVSSYTLKRVQEMLGVSRGVIVGLIDAGFVSPARGPRNEHQFSFQDLMLLRTAQALQSARIPPRKIVRSLAQLRAALPDELPMTGLRITAVGTTVAVHDRTGPREAESGQLLMDFEVAREGNSVSILEPRSAAAPAAKTAAVDTRRTWLDRGEALEPTDPAGAERAYKAALDLDDGYVDAYLNLGALLCDTRRSAEAVTLYEHAVARIPASALLRFNYAIALEDEGLHRRAIEAYERCIALDASFVDAHFNAARILERTGDMQGALRHFNAYRRLQR